MLFPSTSQRRGKTPVLQADEAQTLFDAIDTDSLPGLRDRALIALMPGRPASTTGTMMRSRSMRSSGSGFEYWDLIAVPLTIVSLARFNRGDAGWPSSRLHNQHRARADEEERAFGRRTC
jgi:hypothetical protein